MLADDLYTIRVARHGLAATEKLAAAKVGIAGLGGLGSHIAIALARMGVGHLVLVDFDRVDLSNIQRQNYTLAQVGDLKTEATAANLRAVHPDIRLDLYPDRLTPENIPNIFTGCSLVCEAFDDSGQKAMLVSSLLAETEARVIANSGMAGCASGNLIHSERRFDRLWLCGDGESDVAIDGHLYAPRVALCANHAALLVLRLLLGYDEP